MSTRLSCGYADLGAVKRQCAHFQFQEPRIKLWLFDTLVRTIVLYRVEAYGINLNNPNNGKDFVRHLVSMIARMIRSKALVPHGSPNYSDQ